jgi:hypothetical protein
MPSNIIRICAVYNTCYLSISFICQTVSLPRNIVISQLCQIYLILAYQIIAVSVIKVLVVSKLTYLEIDLSSFYFFRFPMSKQNQICRISLKMSFYTNFCFIFDISFFNFREDLYIL